ncbi:hypothetical protein AncyloWKF20_04345 [Ancylobacter sp. WKF20]|uniref:hypothetical protein n=1 Tax=Ancylobacter sp. WKF20 TaxID=3039801 RepID=UPI0024341999|nr:hypothetical protein [Ancylobacter sp. WKF20]WGD31066.1 hypothetical protein AncyloWKF20_04345 [Ancylobacter sp. WKF20]
MPQLQVSVQVDRIQSNGEWAGAADAPVWLAISLSASWKDVPAAPANPRALVDALLPWKWRGAAGAAAAWNPHDAAAWKIGYVDAAGVYTAIDAQHVAPVSTVIDAPSLITRLDAAIDAIAFENGVLRHDALHLGPRNEETSTKGTVPGFIERLPTLPHPVPCASRSHALLAISRAALTADADGLRFVAAPVFGWRDEKAFVPGACEHIDVNGDGLKELVFRSADPDCIAIVEPSLTKKNMVANLTKGRVIDLFSQRVAVIGGAEAYRFTLPTGESVAELPQRLADAMDPLARIRSVLPRAVAQWRKAATAEAPAPDLDDAALGWLKAVLDLIAAQVLAQRFDTVGRFEVPLIEALIDEDTAAARDLLAAHLASLPVVGPASVPAALRVSQDEMDALGFSEHSPFTLDYLRAVLRGEASGVRLPADTDILRRLWLHRAASSGAPETTRGLRYHELPATQSNRAALHVNRERRPPPALPTGDPAPGTGEPFARTSFERARASAALAFAGPFIEGLVAGRDDWYGAPAVPPPDPPARRGLAERLSGAMAVLLWGPDPKPGLYRTFLARLEGPTPDPVRALLTLILQLAAEEAARLAGRIAFRADPFDRITPLPLPMALQIDQIQTFPRTVDSWTRLSGYGLLVRRSGPSTATNFVSLNPARLYLGGTTDDALIKVPLSATTERNFVDPLPAAPGDQVGVSDAIAEFANSWATAPMAGDPVLDQPGTGGGPPATRVIAAAPPKPRPLVAGEAAGAVVAPLPAFSFGYNYEVAGHLVAQGGVLAPGLRAADNPYLFGVTLDVRDQIATLANYPRTTGIGTPTLSHDLPSLLAPVALIASELPRRLPAQALTTVGLRLNYDQETGGTLIDWPGETNAALCFGFVTTHAGTLTVTIRDPGASAPIHTVELTVPPDPGATPAESGERWWRVEVARSGAATIRFKDLPRRAEEELRADFEEGWTTASTLEAPGAPPGGEGVYLHLASTSLNITVEPGPVRLLIAGQESAETPGSERSARSKPVEPLLLDGLDVADTLPAPDRPLSNRTVRTSVTVTLAGPSIDRHSWERWTNCALFALPHGAPLRQRVTAQLNKLQAKAPPADGRSEEELPDPAVSALCIELWEVFPARRQIGAPLLETADVLERPTASVTLNAAAREAFGRESRRIVAGLRPGHVYELRARAAIRADASPFDNRRPNHERLGRAVLESCTRSRFDGTDWLLGQAVVVPVEVATRDLPIAEQSLASALVASASGDKRAVNLVLPPGLFGEQGPRLLRYCATAGLVPQRWSWRGTPRALSPDDAFYDRADSDVGRVAYGPLRAAHALAVMPRVASRPAPATAPSPPVVLSRDLDWRGGWNLWRFKLRLVSRYAPLFRQEVDARRDLGPAGGWIDHHVKDADNGRAVERPPLALVLPLTETDDAAPGTVPPLLALFSGAMHRNDHFGDRLAVACEIARHPRPSFGDTPLSNLKFLPEVGPDPIRTGRAHSGDAIPLSLDGPIGYSFDRGNPVGPFNHASVIVTPRGGDLAPWSMIKLKFRREEDPEGLGAIPFEPGATELPITSTAPGARHEGIVLDWSDAGAVGEVGLALEPLPRGRSPARAARRGQRVILRAVRTGNQLRLSAWVLRHEDPGPAKSAWAPSSSPNAAFCTIELEAGEVAALRLVVSARSKPEKGDTWQPTGDVAVQLRRSKGPAPELGWLSIVTLPLETRAAITPISEDARLHLKGTTPQTVRPLRLSDYTSSVWCQFTVPSSHFRVAGGGSPRTVAVSDLTLVRNRNATGWGGIELRDGDGPVQLLPDHPVEDTSSVDELRLAVLTIPAHDSLGRMIERPSVVVPLDNLVRGSAPVVTGCGVPIWPSPDTSVPTGQVGRWRIMRVLVRKGASISTLGDLFEETLDPIGATPNPSDAKAMVLSISRPATWAL